MLDEVISASVERPVKLFQKTYRFLHLFSGRRREGDLSHELFVAGQQQNILVIVDSWDTVISDDLDLCKLEKVKNLLARSKQDIIMAAMLALLAIHGL